MLPPKPKTMKKMNEGQRWVQMFNVTHVVEGKQWVERMRIRTLLTGVTMPTLAEYQLEGWLPLLPEVVAAYGHTERLKEEHPEIYKRVFGSNKKPKDKLIPDGSTTTPEIN